jgi:DNA-binding IclR family transcriptional regulator
MALLRLLQARRGRPARLVELAKSLGANSSTCFNILKTLQSDGFVAWDEPSKTYRLGPALLELGLSVAGELDLVRVALPYARALVEEIEFAVLVVTPLADGRFLVADKAESLKPIKVTIAVGEIFPPDAPLLAKCYLAWSSDAEVEAALTAHGLTQFTPRSVTDPQLFKEELADVRRTGYAVSRGEYYFRNTALAAPVFDHEGRIALMLSTLGFSSDLTDADIPTYGGKLVAAADMVTRAIGGQRPRAPDSRGGGESSAVAPRDARLVQTHR